MADDEQFSLCWNNFNSNLSAGFHESLCRGDLVDVTLAAEGQFIKAHRLVLSVCSPYFRKMFTQMPTNQHAFVFLKDVSHSALKDLIQFMYCGEVNVKQDALPAFISTAEALQIKGLTDGDPAPSQSPAKPSTPAPQQIPAQAQQTVTTSLPRPKARTRTQAQTQQYKIETDDSDVEKATQIVIQTSTAPLTTSTPQTIQVQVQTTQQQQQTQTQQQTQQHQTQTVQIQPQTVVSAQKRVAQKSITPHTVKRTKLVQQPDPLEASEPTQITVQTVTESKTNNETEFIDLPIELPTKSEPEYAEDAGGDVETVEQEATYVEDDSYGDMKYDESYFTENDETGANVGGSGTGTAVQATTSTIKQQQPSFSESYVSDAGDQSATEAQDCMDSISQKFKSNDLIPLHAGSTVLVNKNDLIYISHKSLNDPVQYTSKLTHLIFGDEVLIECARKPPKLRFESLDQDCVQSIIYHIVKVFTHRGANVTEEIVMSYIQDRLDQIAKTMILS
ncbi:modifier of mdg4 isoform X9 [Condylostylus longicornis]|uniref:modifier of mdg4 isoform X9 n=1 Tax=Condylostylus longicornis TaxID=2530218 RepID=UPI00244DB640|nr:modifier of mdg4 isoform X9 [Condylostylus longicornis]